METSSLPCCVQPLWLQWYQFSCIWKKMQNNFVKMSVTVVQVSYQWWKWHFSHTEHQKLLLFVHEKGVKVNLQRLLDQQSLLGYSLNKVYNSQNLRHSILLGRITWQLFPDHNMHVILEKISVDNNNSTLWESMCTN